MGLYLSDKETVRLLKDVISETDYQFMENTKREDMMFSFGIIEGKLGLLCDLFEGKYSKEETENAED